MLNFRRYSVSIIFTLFALAGWQYAAPVVAESEFVVPRLSGPIVDEAQMLSRGARKGLESSLYRIKSETGLQIALLTLPELHGYSIEEVSIKVTDQWKLGTEKQDKGVLLLLAKKERKVRIEVGQGLEGVLTDAHSKRIIEQKITPLLRSGNIDAAMTMGLFSIAQQVNADRDMSVYFEGSNANAHNGNRSKRSLSLWELILYGAILLILISTRQGRDLLLLLLIFGRNGGGGGGSGGGFGGYGGDGGGFSGGGSSGDW